ncbi:MAG: hypothetical protein L0H73_17685 [Nitrococcus sp.]|nr:hypothetical protein [Nitrococcus sp.]
MSHIRGILVYLVTHQDSDSGTDDWIYLGLWGTDGGREFPLASDQIDDFETSSARYYHLGRVPPGELPSDAVRPHQTAPGEANDPEPLDIELNSVQHVYLRKAEYGSYPDGDNAYKLGYVYVALYGVSERPARTFNLLIPENKGLWLANGNGHRAWLKPI